MEFLDNNNNIEHNYFFKLAIVGSDYTDITDLINILKAKNEYYGYMKNFKSGNISRVKFEFFLTKIKFNNTIFKLQIWDTTYNNGLV